MYKDRHRYRGIEKRRKGRKIEKQRQKWRKRKRGGGVANEKRREKKVHGVAAESLQKGRKGTPGEGKESWSSHVHAGVVKEDEACHAQH